MNIFLCLNNFEHEMEIAKKQVKENSANKYSLSYLILRNFFEMK